ncbi:MAG: Fur family transcriptional regulator [Bacillota bacterium]
MAKNTRMTKQRKAILRVLKNTKSHPTADWIYEQVKKEIPNISLGTVYRNLNVLSELGKIQILDYGSTYSRYDGNPENHYHFRCEKCGKVFDIHVDLFDDINKIVNEETAFQVNEHRLEFTGLCPECQNKN